MDSQRLLKQEIIDHNLQVKAIIQVSYFKEFTQFTANIFALKMKIEY